VVSDVVGPVGLGDISVGREHPPRNIVIQITNITARNACGAGEYGMAALFIRK